MSIRLDEFMRDWLRDTVVWPTMKSDVSRAGLHSGTTIFRDGHFMVQSWASPPNSEITDHSHPHLNGWAVRFAGEIEFRVNGRRARPKIVTLLGKRQPAVEVPAGVSHGATIGADGAIFLAITEWLDGPPTSVHLDWQGAPLDEVHMRELLGA